MIDFMKPAEIPNGCVQQYCLDILCDRELVTMYRLEHPDYDTEEDYGLILEAWKFHRSWWTKEAKLAGRDEYLPKPKRRPGRPMNQKALEERRKAEAERQAARAARQAAREEARAERERRAKERAAERDRRLKEKASGAVVITLRVPEHILAGIFQVKGDLSIGDCLLQLAEHALGPLAQK